MTNIQAFTQAVLLVEGVVTEVVGSTSSAWASISFPFSGGGSVEIVVLTSLRANSIALLLLGALV